MNEEDELDINPFFISLQTNFSSIYDKAQENCCLICVPQSDCLQRVTITEKFVSYRILDLSKLKAFASESVNVVHYIGFASEGVENIVEKGQNEDLHILKASPFFKGQYISLLSDKHVVCISDDGNHVYTQEGFPTKVKIKILSEELGYNKDYKPYKILIIERPLDQNVLKKQKHEEANYSGEVTPKLSLKECKEFLCSFPELSKHIKDLDEQLRQFNRNYVLLQDYLDDAVTRLHSITSSTSEKCLKSCPKKLVNHKFRDVLCATVETYVLACVHGKLFPVVCSKYSKEDKQLLETCVSLSGLTPDQLNVPEHFCCPLPSAVVELAHLDRLQTPVEKLYCLKTTFDNLTQEINSHIEMLQPPGISREEIPCLTSDDFIPILVTVIVRAKCSHLHSDVYYMENFNWSASVKDKDNLSYCLVTFKAAIQYMTSPDFNQTQLHKHLAQNEMSFEEIMTINKDFKMEPSTSRKTSNTKQWRPRTTSQSRLDQQLKNIAKMLDESTAQEGLDRMRRKSPIVSSVFNGSYQNPSPTLEVPKSSKDSNKEKKDKGEFLSQLENDIFLTS